MRLCVQLPRLAALAADTPLAFAVIDSGRAVQRRGEAVLAALPGGMDTELVLHPHDVLLLPVRLPKLGGAKLGAALPGLVEDRLAGDADQAHVVASPVGADGMATAAVVDRALFARALALAARVGLRIVSAVPAPMALPSMPGSWHVSLAGAAGCVRHGEHAGVGFAADPDAPPVELRLLVAQAGAPRAIEIAGECDTEAWSRGLGVPVRAVPPPVRWPPPTLDLLRYAFAPRVVDARAWRAAGWLAAALLVIAVGGLNVHAWQLRGEARELRNRMTRVVQETFPQVPVVLDPVVQMRRLVDELRPGAESGAFVALAQALSTMVAADALQSLDYRDGALEAVLRTPAREVEARRADFATLGARAGVTVRIDGATLRLVPKAAP